MVPLSRERGGDENPPHPGPPEWWAPRPSPRLRHLAPHFRMSSRMCGSRVQDDAGGGGVGGRGVDSRAGVTNPSLLTESPPLPQPHPTPTKSRPDCPPSYPRGRGATSWELGRVGLMEDSTPQVPAPTRATPELSAFRTASTWDSEGRRRLRGQERFGWGRGRHWGLPRLWVVGWAWVPRTCLPPPPHPWRSSRARSVLDTGVGAGKIEAS